MVLGLPRSSSSSSLVTGDGLTKSSSVSTLTKALKRISTGNLSGLTGMNAGLCGAKQANADADIKEEEVGEWRYLIIDPRGVRPRAEANYSKDSKVACRYPEGIVIEVDRRRKNGWTTFLRVKGSDDVWLFDVSPKDKKVRLVEVEVLTGDWEYEVCAFERVPVLPCPARTSKNGFKASTFLDVLEVVHISKRVRPISGKGSFLKLADGRGWVLDFADGCRHLQPHTSQGDSELSEASTSSSLSLSNCGDSCSMESEVGSWEYVVLDSRGMSVRCKPTYDPKQKTSRRIHEGEIVVATERRFGDGMTFLKLDCPQGWVFDRQPGSKSRVRMMEANVERGNWHYIVTAESGIALRTRCSFSDNTKCGKGPEKGALIEVSQRVQIGQTTFLQLKESGRWIFDAKAGRKMLAGPVEVQVFGSDSMATVTASEGVNLSQSPTNQSWATTKMRLLQNAKVQVKKVVDAESVSWGLVAKPGSNMEGWLRLDDLCLGDTPPSKSDLRTIGSTPTPQAGIVWCSPHVAPMQAFSEASSCAAGPSLSMSKVHCDNLLEAEFSQAH